MLCYKFFSSTLRKQKAKNFPTRKSGKTKKSRENAQNHNGKIKKRETLKPYDQQIKPQEIAHKQQSVLKPEMRHKNNIEKTDDEPRQRLESQMRRPIEERKERERE